MNLGKDFFKSAISSFVLTKDPLSCSLHVVFQTIWPLHLFRAESFLYLRKLYGLVCNLMYTTFTLSALYAKRFTIWLFWTKIYTQTLYTLPYCLYELYLYFASLCMFICAKVDVPKCINVVVFVSRSMVL
jgi:hypothetical protein